MHVRPTTQWKKSRRDNSIGPLRRAHPASGATWNVQVVRGKMSTQCLWHACRALMVGILLMVIGASMATIGYYSNDFALSDIKNHTTVRVKNEQRGLHLNNLSYTGPIIMGVGGELNRSPIYCCLLFPSRVFFSTVFHRECTGNVFHSSEFPLASTTHTDSFEKHQARIKKAKKFSLKYHNFPYVHAL